MGEIPVVWVLVSMVVLILGPAGAAYVDVRRQVLGVVDSMDQDRADTREWLKALQTETSGNTKDIAVLAAVLSERTEHGE